MFLIGLAPAILAIPIFLRLKEPERWKAVARDDEAAGKAKLGSLGELFGDPRWRKNTLVGMLLAFAGVVGLWGIGFFSFDLVDVVFRKHFQGQGLSPQQIAGKLTFWKGITSLVAKCGAFFGIYAFALVTHTSAASRRSPSRSCWPPRPRPRRSGSSTRSGRSSS